MPWDASTSVKNNPILNGEARTDGDLAFIADFLKVNKDMVARGDASYTSDKICEWYEWGRILLSECGPLDLENLNDLATFAEVYPIIASLFVSHKVIFGLGAGTAYVMLHTMSQEAQLGKLCRSIIHNLQHVELTSHIKSKLTVTFYKDHNKVFIRGAAFASVCAVVWHAPLVQIWTVVVQYGGNFIKSITFGRK